MTENLDPQTATRAALAEEINRLRAQRDEARRDLATATTALERIRKLCVGRRVVATDALRAVLPAAGNGPAATGGRTP